MQAAVDATRPAPCVLVVEDDESHALALRIGLEHEGYVVTAVPHGADALGAYAALRPDVVVLDVTLPGLSGIEICRELRAQGVDTPIIMLSARGDELDVVVGIEVGADDYLAKPYRVRELSARIGALLRRRRMPTAPVGRSGADDVLVAGDLALDSARHVVTVRNVPVQLPLREFQLLRELLIHAGRVVTRDELLERVWGLGYDGDARIVATLIGRLRARLEADPAAPTRIVTIRGVGYRLDAPG